LFHCLLLLLLKWLVAFLFWLLVCEN
jgi:hypothetical protein